MPLISGSSTTDQEEIGYILQAKLSDSKGERVEGSIKILSLYSIYYRNCLYQNFLILSQLRTDIDRYKQIGVGTGKIYYDTELSYNYLEDPQFVEPFKWLSVDLARKGRTFDRVVEKVICIV
jgi:hypothetical protein